MMVSHARYTHLVESIDITNTELEEVNIFTYSKSCIADPETVTHSFRFKNPDAFSEAKITARLNIKAGGKLIL
jgi:hypothetical protein